ncbi:MAG: hypothetical protein M0R20_04765 [Candidatus Omnitrophica bacterium]|jgi:hypothetical protein|nr:hypothetical protein [Candidatus Omnitrophota bacterium]
MKKIFAIFILSVFLLVNSYAVDADIDIPLALKDLGFESEDLVDYNTEYNEEHFTLANWQTEDPTDTITFVMVDGEIVDWISR